MILLSNYIILFILFMYHCWQMFYKGDSMNSKFDLRLTCRSCWCVSCDGTAWFAGCRQWSSTCSTRTRQCPEPVCPWTACVSAPRSTPAYRWLHSRPIARSSYGRDLMVWGRENRNLKSNIRRIHSNGNYVELTFIGWQWQHATENNWVINL